MLLFFMSRFEHNYGYMYLGIVTKNTNYYAAIFGFILGEKIGKTAGWHD